MVHCRDGIGQSLFDQSREFWRIPECCHVYFTEEWPLQRPPLSRKRPGGSKLLSFTDDGAHYAFWDLECSRYFSVPSPDQCLNTVLWRSTYSSSDCTIWFILQHALSATGLYIVRWESFQIMFNKLNLPQEESIQVIETTDIWLVETGCTWAQFWVSWQMLWILMYIL